MTTRDAGLTFSREEWLVSPQNVGGKSWLLCINNSRWLKTPSAISPSIRQGFNWLSALRMRGQNMNGFFLEIFCYMSIDTNSKVIILLHQLIMLSHQVWAVLYMVSVGPLYNRIDCQKPRECGADDLQNMAASAQRIAHLYFCGRVNPCILFSSVNWITYWVAATPWFYRHFLAWKNPRIARYGCESFKYTRTFFFISGYTMPQGPFLPQYLWHVPLWSFCLVSSCWHKLCGKISHDI